MAEQGLPEHLAKLMSEPQLCCMCDRGPSKDRQLTRGARGYLCNECVWSLARSMALSPPRRPAEQRQTLSPFTVFPTLRELVRVVPAGLTEVVDGIEVTLLSVELYTDGFIVNGRIVRGVPDEQDPNVEWTLVMDLRARFEPDDGRGGAYRGGGYRGDGDEKEWRFGYTFGPTLDPETRELRVTIADLRQVRFDLRAPEDRSGDVRCPGPWVFKIDVT